MEKTIELPWPPTVNTYLRMMNNRMVKTKRARQYCDDVFYAVKQQKVASFGEQRLEVHIKAYPPDSRRRDLDNITKVLFDSLETVKVYKDDCQIDFFSVQRMQKVKGGRVLVTIKTIDKAV